MLPIVLAHKWMFGFSLLASFIGLAVQVQIPNEVGQAIDSLGKTTDKSLEYFVSIIVVLAVIRFVLTYLSRNYLLKTAYHIEYDLRNIIYEHLSRMSFSFYDRVQSGQLISRANSDIRSVQMYLTFAPSILVQCSVAVVAFAYMLSINVPLALVTMSTMPFVYIVGVRMRKQMFPVSWLIQSRLADVATIVDENINGVRVVKSFAAEEQQLQHLTRRRDARRVGQRQGRRHPGQVVAAAREPAPPRPGARAASTAATWSSTASATVGDIVAFNAYVLMLQAPFRLLGMLIMMGQRAVGVGAAHLRGARRAARRRRPPRRRRPRRVPGRRPLRRRVVRLRQRHRRCSTDFDLHLRPGETVALVGRTGSGQVDRRPGCWPASTT